MTPDIVRLLGLDLSLTGTGVARPDGATCTISTKPDKTSGCGDIARCRFIMRRVREEVRASEATYVVVEGAVHMSTAALVTGQLRGIVLLGLLEAGIPWTEVPPASLKKFATDNGGASKDMMIAHAIREFGFEGSNNNEADAFLLRMMGEASLGRFPKMSKQRLLQVARIDWPWDVEKLL